MKGENVKEWSDMSLSLLVTMTVGACVVGLGHEQAGPMRRYMFSTGVQSTYGRRVRWTTGLAHHLPNITCSIT